MHVLWRIYILHTLLSFGGLSRPLKMLSGNKRKEIKKPDHWIMQIQTFDWLSAHAISAITQCPTNGGYQIVFLKHKISKILLIFIVFKKAIIPLTFIGYEIIITNAVLRASLAIYLLISHARSWNNC